MHNDEKYKASKILFCFSLISKLLAFVRLMISILEEINQTPKKCGL